MQIHLKYIDDVSDKFWQIETHENQFTVTYGRNGTSGTSQTKTFDTDEECLKNAEKLVAEKKKKGYSESGEVMKTSKTTSTINSKTSDLQTITKEFDEILTSEKFDLLLPFLQEKIKGNIAGFKAHIKKSKRYWMTYVDLSKERTLTKKEYQWGIRGNQNISKIIVHAGIAVLDAKEINSWQESLNYFNDILTDETSKKLILWAKPNWLENYLLTLSRSNSWRNIDYDVLLFLEKNGLISYNAELIALCLNRFNYHYKRKEFNSLQFLLDNPITTARDVKNLFLFPTEIANQRDYQSGKTYYYWNIYFEKLIEKELLNRQFALENSLLIQTKEWNNNIKTFFRGIIDLLQPKTEELLKLQENIFPLLQNPHTAVANYGIQLIKQIYELKGFEIQSFIDWVGPILMREDMKTGIKTLMIIFEKLAKNDTKFASKLSILVADIFTLPVADLQERATKFILKNGNKKDIDLTEKLNLYVTQMQGTNAQQLFEFLDKETQNNINEIQNSSVHYQFIPQKSKLLTQPVELPSTWNDIFFSIGKFIKSEEVLDSEILWNVFIQQQNLLPTDFSSQVQPYEKQLIKSHFPSPLQSSTKSFLLHKFNNINHKTVFNKNYNNIKILDTAQYLIEIVDEKIKNKSLLPLLCFPSHAPYWIAPKVLLQRILDYTNANETIYEIDLAVAISRMPREQVEDALPLIEKIPNEYQNLFKFSLGLIPSPELEFLSFFDKVKNTINGTSSHNLYIRLNALSARNHEPETIFPIFEKTNLDQIINVVYPFFPKIQFKEKWNEWKDYHTKELIRSASWWEMQMEMPEFKPLKTSLLHSLDLYNHGENYWYYQFYSSDSVIYWHSLTPLNDETLSIYLLNVASKNASDGNFELKGFLNIVQLPEFQFRYHSMLLFSSCFFREKKEIRFMASEILYQLIESQKIDLEQFAKHSSYFIVNNYGAFSRFSDAILSLKDSSPLHNKFLFRLIDLTLPIMDQMEKLPVNFKKLLENYYDLQSKLLLKPSESTISMLEKRKENTSLKKLIGLILK